MAASLARITFMDSGRSCSGLYALSDSTLTEKIDCVSAGATKKDDVDWKR